MKLVKKVVVIILMCAFIFSLINYNSVFAYGPSDMLSTIEGHANKTATGNVVDSVTDISGSIITIARVICAGVAVAMLCILGMKYMTSAPSEKADIKKHAVVYIVGAVVMFACTGILGIIQNFASSL